MTLISHSMNNPHRLAHTSDLEQVVCDYCGKDDADILGTLPPLTELPFPMHRFGASVIETCGAAIHFMRCRTCGLVYMNPRLTESAIARFYDKVYPLILPRADYEQHHDVRSHYLLDITAAYLAPSTAPVSVLDIGCGGGQFLSAAQERGWQIYGSEVSTVAAQAVSQRLGVSIHIGDFRDMPLPLESLDVITLLEVMEHLRAPVDFVRDAVALLKPGGMLVIEVPNIAAAEYRLARLLGQMYRGFIVEHLYYFSPRFMQTLMRDLNMRVVRMSSKHAEMHLPNPLRDIRNMLDRNPPPVVDTSAAESNPAVVIPPLPPVSLPKRIARQLNNYLLDVVSALSQGRAETLNPVGNTLYVWARKARDTNEL